MDNQNKQAPPVINPDNSDQPVNASITPVTNSPIVSSIDKKNKLNKPLSIVISLLVLILVLGSFARLVRHHHNSSVNQLNATTTSQTQDPEENRAYDDTVTIQPNSFSPATLTVYSCTKVHFFNAGTVANLASVPAGSNYGPAREIVASPTNPGPDKNFKDSGIIAAPDSWSYIFTKPGTYTYVDANNVTINGTVVVKPLPASVHIQDNCESSST